MAERTAFVRIGGIEVVLHADGSILIGKGDGRVELDGYERDGLLRVLRMFVDV